MSTYQIISEKYTSRPQVCELNASATRKQALTLIQTTCQELSVSRGQTLRL